MKKRKYTLFNVTLTEKNGVVRKQYEQASEILLEKEQAVRVFQNRLLTGAMGQGPLCELRPIKEKE